MQEMLASMPARKFRSLRNTQRLLTMASIVRPRFLWKATSCTPRAFACLRLSRLAAPDLGFERGTRGQALAGALKRGHGGAGGCDEIPVELRLAGLAAAVLDGKGAFLGEPAVIAPDDRRSRGQ